MYKRRFARSLEGVSPMFQPAMEHILYLAVSLRHELNTLETMVLSDSESKSNCAVTRTMEMVRIVKAMYQMRMATAMEQVQLRKGIPMEMILARLEM